ncbi:histidine--tRNA ligase [Brumimicrobium aurantiacum]|uniref:Histidine--tRNA ligase n=1 Tax=Brumimicrobium aurantiacum TaxID=1737063 RepID=A0A3E1EYS2_9FLAO|nr:histidine--tRNA ligase [Brumimicrobium aurantiacum]RFC54633.1 histidine--tRNA ligase [Brumimicrobium aurantiacum]
MAQKPSIPKGTRDFLPFQVNRRNYIYDTIRTVFKKYGFAPIETPSFELSSTLMGKYGEEGDRLIFRILNSGDKVKKADLSALEQGNLPRFANSLSEKALRYDLTVPFARFVVQHQNDLTFPFKRYQIQPVWRADRPQKGRYQEFYQCDADVVGSDSLLFEVDFIQIFDEVLSALKVPDFTIQINNRKILSGIAEVTGEEDKIIDITVAIDKLDKIGEEGVIKELTEKEVSQQAIDMIRPLFNLNGDTQKMLAFMQEFLAESEVGKKGIEELEYVFAKTELLGLQNAKLEFDVTLARGLNYYTGAIFEVKANGVKMGSICGGGRYDDLTGLFGMKGLSGVGISFGADRIYDVLTELELFPTDINQTLRFLFINFGEQEVEYALPILRDLRNNGVTAEIYPSNAKLKKQFKYADDRNAEYTVIIGESELENKEITVKEMKSGEQETMALESFIAKHCK